MPAGSNTTPAQQAQQKLNAVMQNRSATPAEKAAAQAEYDAFVTGAPDAHPNPAALETQDAIDRSNAGGFWSDLSNYASDAVTGGAPRRVIQHLQAGDVGAAATQAANMGGTPLGAMLEGGQPEGAPVTPWHDENGDWTGPESVGNVRNGILGAYGIKGQNASAAGGGGGMGSASGPLSDAVRRSGQLGAQADTVYQNAAGYSGVQIPLAQQIAEQQIAARPIADQAPVDVALRAGVERYQAGQIQAARDVQAQQIAAAQLAPFARMDAAQPGAAQQISAPTVAPAVAMAGPDRVTAAQATATDPNAQRIDLSGQLGNQAAQLRALGVVENEAAGTGVGGQLADARLQSALGGITENNLSIAGQARGSERAGARREAMLQNSRQAAGATQQSNEAALASRLGAIGQLTGATQGARGQDIDLATQQAGLSAQAENLRAQLQTATAQGNAQEVNRLTAQYQALQQAAREQGAGAQNDNQRLAAQLQLSASQGNQSAVNDRSALTAQLQQAANQTNATGQNAYGALGAQLQQQANIANQGAALTAAQGNQSTEAGRYTAQAGLDTSANAGNAGAWNTASAQDQAAVNQNRQAAADRLQQAEITRSQQALAAAQANQNANLSAQASNQTANAGVEQNRATNWQTDQQIRQQGMTGAINAGTGATQAEIDAAKVAAAAEAAKNKQSAENFSAVINGAASAYSAYQGNKKAS